MKKISDRKALLNVEVNDGKISVNIKGTESDLCFAFSVLVNNLKEKMDYELLDLGFKLGNVDMKDNVEKQCMKILKDKIFKELD